MLRSLLWLWCMIGLFGASGATALAVLGPLPERHAERLEPVAEATRAEPEHARPEPAQVEPAQVEPAKREPAKPEPAHVALVPPVEAHSPGPVAAFGAIAPPDPALLEASALYEGGRLPRIGVEGRRPMQAYAAAFNASDTRPRVAVLLAGIGMNEAESLAASANLPRTVSLAVSPYARRMDKLLDAARAAGHELLLSIPMEPQGYPLNDPGKQALLTGASPTVNEQRLEWAMTRFSGYAGATGALGEMRGERLAAAGDQMSAMLATLAQRGLLYVDPRPAGLHPASPSRSGAVQRGVDLVLDDPAGAAELDAALARLEKVARDRGSAIGLAGRPTPGVVDRIAVWAAGLEARGVALAPVSVVVQMPQAPLTVAPLNVARITAPK